MSIALASIDKALFTWVLMLGCLLGGVWGFINMGRLEDPAFSIKTAVIFTQYPGASAEEVAREVSEPLESAIQRMAEVHHITSSNSPGLSRISVDVDMTYGPDELPQIWDKLRNRVEDAQRSLPAGARDPIVNSGFGDVFGLFFAVTAPGFTDAEIHDLSAFMRRSLLTVDGVANVTLDGLPNEVIFVEPEQAIVNNLGLSTASIMQAIANANHVTEAGSVNQNGNKIRLAVPLGSSTVAEIQNLTIGVSGEVISVRDFARVYRGRTADPTRMIRFNGEEAFTLGVSGKEDVNIVDIGHSVDEKLESLMKTIPYGVGIHPIYQQNRVVEEASNAFLVNLALSVVIVIAVLAVSMGWRAAIVVGTTLLLSVVGTLFFMALFGIEMQRISLGALIIAMGMLVDNAIVVAEGMQNDMAQGKSSRTAAVNIARKTQIPLLGATVIGIMAFAGIGLSPDATGEFLFSLFAVIGISLFLSWVLSITVTPLLGHYFFRRGSGEESDQYGGPIFRAYEALLRVALKFRWLVIAGLISVTAICYYGFSRVPQQFFPDSNTPIFFVHYKLPQGASIDRTSQDMAVLEDWLAERDDVVSFATFVGGGASRFLLTYSSEQRLTTYGHLIIRTNGTDDIPLLRDNLQAFGKQALPDGLFRTERLVFGPGGGTPIQARFSGPDPIILRQLAAQAKQRMQAASDRVQDVRQDWYEPELVLRPTYAADRAQTAGVSREDIANVLEMATVGLTAGVYREGDRQIPIVMRTADGDTPRAARLLDQPVYSVAAGGYVPVAELVDGFAYVVEDTFIQRRDRQYTITVQSGVPNGVNAASVFSEIRGTLENMALPTGYSFAWGGEHETQSEAQESLGMQLPLSLLIMVLISVLLFGKLRQPLIIWLLVPMAVNGVVIGLLASGLPFSFTALLGLLSLSGMLIKNGIVLVEEIDLTRAEGMPLQDAIVRASTTRVRPVFLAAVTTILGMLPLLSDAFFASMAVTIMGGLGFASILTLVAAPVLYRVFFSNEMHVKVDVSA